MNETYNIDEIGVVIKNPWGLWQAECYWDDRYELPSVNSIIEIKDGING